MTTYSTTQHEFTTRLSAARRSPGSRAMGACSVDWTPTMGVMISTDLQGKR
jgi:hypothetical protein